MSQAQDWINKNYPPEKFTPGLSRIHKAISLFKVMPASNKVITVAGTNGKGTVSRNIYSNILENGKSCALFTSPHLLSICERFEFNQKKIGDPCLINAFKVCHETLIEKELKLSFYEFTLLVFLYLALNKKVEYVVLEVGLGGRLDATNAVLNDLAIITSISRDHKEILGNSFKKILLEKIAIAKKRLIFSSSLDFLLDEALKYSTSKKIEASLLKDDGDIDSRNKFILKQTFFFLDMAFRGYSRHIVYNYNDRISYSCCHNLDAVRSCVNEILENKDLVRNRILILSYSHREFKDLEYMSKLFLKLSNSVKGIFITEIGQFKSASKESLMSLSESLNIPFLDKKDINAIKNKEKIYLSGSNYFIGEFLSKYS